MGLFSSKKKTYVSSAIYNLAGDIETRPDFLKSVVLGNIVTNSDYSIVDSVRSSYMGGPGLRMRRYYNWAVDNYQLIGVPSDTIRGEQDFSTGLIGDEIETKYGFTEVYVNWVEGGVADIAYWGLQWVLEHAPTHKDYEFTVDYDEATGQATITWEAEAGREPDSFTPNGFITNRMCLYVSYTRGLMGPYLFIYPYGSGSSVLDAQLSLAGSYGRYLPYIPLRHENKFLSESYLPDAYEIAKSAYKKAMNDDYDSLIGKIAENDSLGDIDFAYLVFGVSLNTKEASARKYLWKFFEYLADQQVTANSDYTTWVNSVSAYSTQYAVWESWYEGGQVGAEPTKPTVSSAPVNSIRIRDTGSVKTNFDMEIKWSAVTKHSGTGLGKPGAEVGEYWCDYVAGTTTTLVTTLANIIADVTLNDTFRIWRQVTATSWERINIVGLKHINNIYNGKYVEITADEALDDSEESGFLIPINYDLLKEMSIKDSTQMSTACSYIVFNCYQIVKQKWYQTGWFKILLVIAVIVISVAFPPAGAAAGGILGSSVAVGTALGFSGLAALIAGTVANVVASMILTQILTKVSVAVFGEKLGLIIGAIASVVTGGIMTGMQQGLTMAEAVSSLMNITNLIGITTAVGNGIAGVIGLKAQETMQKTQNLIEDYNKQSNEISKAYAEEFGYGTTYFDPMSLTYASSYAYESPGSFLARTLMTGSDIAQMSNDLLTNFTELTLRLDLP